MINYSRPLFIILLTLSLLFTIVYNVEAQVDYSLEEEFVNPPQRAKPRTWMHAMSGNMSKAGITEDLESMSNVGIGGFLLFNVTQGIPNGPIKYNSTAHHKLIQHAAEEAERLDLSFGVHNCDGWSASGGPWIRPEESMKMIVWNETLVEGGKVDISIEQPTTREGFYEDIALVAYPSLSTEIDDQLNLPSISASDKKIDLDLISDGKLEMSSKLKMDRNELPWIQYEYPEEKSIRSAMVVFRDRQGEASLQVSENGTDYVEVRKLFKVRTGKGEWAINDHFPEIRSKYFRLVFNEEMDLKELRLTSNYFLNNPLGRTSIARTEDRNLDNIGDPTNGQTIPLESIKIFTSEIKDNKLKIELPKGKWTLLRFGYTSTGAFNNPASDEGRGLEVDKLSRPPMKKHYEAFVRKVVNNTKSLAPHALQYAEIDSYEMGGQNWTEKFDSLFYTAKDYDFLPFLPLVAGRFVESAAVSQAVLWDFRKVICDLMTQNYFAYFTELCNEDGIQSYIEPYGFGPLNDLDIVAFTDLPMGEFWMNRPITQTKSAVSGAHIYGKPIISAESFTSNPTINWKGNPAMAKGSGDLAWTEGINEFMFHRFAHQANTHVEPGMTMNRWGFHFDRTQTWWENAGKDWFRYIARGSHLLRQGVPVSDFLVFVGDGSPNSTYDRSEFSPVMPLNIHFDCVNADVLKHRIVAQDGKMTLPEGTEYQALVLRNMKYIEPETLLRLKELAEQGIPIYGDLPQTIAGYGHQEDIVNIFNNASAFLKEAIIPIKDWNEIVKDLEIDLDFIIKGRNLPFEHRRTENEDIYFFFNSDSTSQNFQTTFRIKNKIPELWNPMSGEIVKSGSFSTQGKKTTVSISLDAGESVFVVFKESTDERVLAAEPSTDLPELVLKEDNQMSALIENNGSYNIKMNSGENWSFTVADILESINLDQNWNLSLDGNKFNIDKLIDWKEHSKDELKYFSGTASYRNSFDCKEEVLQKGMKIFLELGEVEIVAEVFLNGQYVATDWMPPFEVEITDFVRAGRNELEVKVTNLWSNKLIGDERFPSNDGGYKLGPHRATELTMPEWYTKNEPRPIGPRTSFTTAPFYTETDALLSSGLLGPVKLKFKKEVKFKK